MSIKPETPAEWAAYFQGRASIKWAPTGEKEEQPELTKEQLPWYAMGMMDQMSCHAAVYRSRLL